MSFDIIKELIEGFENTIQTVLGSDWKKLDYIFEIDKNSLSRNSKRFGVRAVSGISDSGVTRALTMNHDFEIILTDSYINKDGSDEKQRELVDELHKKIFEIFNSIFLTKAGKPQYIMNLNKLNLNEIEFITDDNITILRSQITVIYRQSLT